MFNTLKLFGLKHSIHDLTLLDWSVGGLDILQLLQNDLCHRSRYVFMQTSIDYPFPQVCFF